MPARNAAGIFLVRRLRRTIASIKRSYLTGSAVAATAAAVMTFGICAIGTRR